MTSHFSHGSVPAPAGYSVDESFYPRSSRLPSNTLRRRLTGLAEHLPGMLRQRRAAAAADLVHFQWLTLPRLDASLLPRGRPLVLTAHGFLRSADERGAADAGVVRALKRFDAIVSHSEYGAERLRSEAGIDPARVHVIPHGAFDYLTRLPEPAPLPPELQGAEGPVVLCFGLIRPYKGVDVLLDAFREVEGAELWIVGRPLGVDLGDLERRASRARSPRAPRLALRPRRRVARDLRAAPTSSPCPTATPSSRASSTRRSLSARRSSPATSAGSARSPSATAPCASCRPAIRRRLPGH